MWFRRTPPVDVESLRLRVREAATWCDHLLSTGAPLRSVELLPARGEAEIAEERESGRARPPWVPKTIFERLGHAPIATCAAVVAARASLIESRRVSMNRPVDGFPRSGRVLCCFVNASLMDVVCHQESKGFLDEDDLPPCATWIGYVPSKLQLLLTWTPERHVPDVDAAMPCCPTEAYAWLTSVDPRLERAILRGR